MSVRLLAKSPYDSEYYEDPKFEPFKPRENPCRGSPLDLAYPQVDAKTPRRMKSSERFPTDNFAR